MSNTIRIREKFIGNIDGASRRLHHVPTSDGRCKLQKVIQSGNDRRFNTMGEVDREIFPEANDCFWCIGRFPRRPF